MAGRSAAGAGEGSRPGWCRDLAEAAPKRVFDRPPATESRRLLGLISEADLARHPDGRRLADCIESVARVVAGHQA